MIPGLITPAGNLGGLTPHQVCVAPIAAVNLAVGDLVMFDLSGSNTTYTDLTKINDLDDKKNPLCRGSVGRRRGWKCFDHADRKGWHLRRGS
jgi:hypothetical protein